MTDTEFIDIERELIDNGAPSRCKGRRIYLNSLKAGNPISGAEVARTIGMSERWGQDCVKEVREFVKAHADYYGSDLLALVQTRPGSPPQSLPPVAEPTPPTSGAAAHSDPHEAAFTVASDPPAWLADEADHPNPQTLTESNIAAPIAAPAGQAHTRTTPHEDPADPHGTPHETGPVSEPAPSVQETPVRPAEAPADPHTGPQHDPHETAADEAHQSAPVRPADETADPHTRPHEAAQQPRKRVKVWAVWLLMAPAAVAIWGGWVGLGEMAGFGVVNLLPGIANFEVNTAITLPVGMEVYAAFALYVWLSGRVGGRALTFARRSAILSLFIGALGQIAYHVMEAAGVTVAPWWITAAVSCLPVAVLGMGAALAHLVIAERDRPDTP